VVKLTRRDDPTAPRGVAGRNSDNTLIRQVLGWEPSTSLRVGLERTYAWIHDQIMARVRARRPVDVRPGWHGGAAAP
jgi:GDP-D-mannose 3', 5'-epimerase